MLATQKAALFMGDMCKELVTRYRLGYAQAKELRDAKKEVELNNYEFDHPDSDLAAAEAAEHGEGDGKGEGDGDGDGDGTGHKKMPRISVTDLKHSVDGLVRTKGMEKKVDPELDHYAMQFTLKSFGAGHSSGQSSLKGVLEERVMVYCQGDVLESIEEVHFPHTHTHTSPPRYSPVTPPHTSILQAVQNDSVLQHVPGLTSGLFMGLMLTIPSLLAACMMVRERATERRPTLGLPTLVLIITPSSPHHHPTLTLSPPILSRSFRGRSSHSLRWANKRAR